MEGQVFRRGFFGKEHEEKLGDIIVFKESEQAAAKITDKDSKEKTEAASELEEERTRASTPPRESQATQHRMDYYTLQAAEPQACPADIKRAYRELALKGHPHKNLGESAETVERSQEDGQTCAGGKEDRIKKRQNTGRMTRLLTTTLVTTSLACMIIGVMEPTSPHGGWTAGNLRQRKPTGKAKLKSEFRAWERNLLSMVGASMACQTTAHLGYSWCVAALTTLAVGVRGHQEQEPEPDRGGVSRGEGQEEGTPERIRTKPEGKRRERTEVHIAQAERNLSFLTAAGAVCQMTSP